MPRTWFALCAQNIDPETSRASRRKFDVSGHYARADVFTLQMDRPPQSPLAFI